MHNLCSELDNLNLNQAAPAKFGTRLHGTWIAFVKKPSNGSKINKIWNSLFCESIP